MRAPPRRRGREIVGISAVLLPSTHAGDVNDCTNAPRDRLAAITTGLRHRTRR